MTTSQCCEPITVDIVDSSSFAQKAKEIPAIVAKWAASTWPNIELRHQQKLDRAAFQHLKVLDERTLMDIGLRKEDVLWADSLPLSCNASQELEKICRSNRSTLQPEHRREKIPQADRGRE